MNYLSFDLQIARKGWLWGFSGNSETEGLAKEIFISLLEKEDVRALFELPKNDSRTNRLLERGLVEEKDGLYQFTKKAIGLIYAEWGKQ